MTEAHLHYLDLPEPAGSDRGRQPRKPGRLERIPRYIPKEYSVYLGRRRLGLVRQVGPRRFEAFDAQSRLIGRSKSQAKAISAVSKSAKERS
jgi:hypothetical protein